MLSLSFHKSVCQGNFVSFQLVNFFSCPQNRDALKMYAQVLNLMKTRDM